MASSGNDPQRCGNCKWWELREPERQLGWCNQPIPDCVNEVEVRCMYDHNGTNCPCHQRKEKSE